MTFTQALGVLVVEPYNQRVADIAEMDDDQIAAIFFPERDEDGRPLPPKREEDETEDKPAFKTPRDMFFWAAKRAGFPDETIEARWRMRLEKHPNLDENGMPRRGR